MVTTCDIAAPHPDTCWVRELLFWLGGGLWRASRLPVRLSCRREMTGRLWCCISPPDMIFLVIGSLLACFGVHQRQRWAAVSVGILLGAWGYATIHLLAWVSRTGQGWLGVVMMTLALGGTLLVFRDVQRPTAPSP
jgi:hypothetical protein